MQLTWSSPLPPTRSGVADYADELVPHLSELAQVTVIEPPDGHPQVAWGEKVTWIPSDAPPVGLELLHLGNNPYHLWVVARLRQFGGVVVLHDAVLHHLLVEEAATTENWQWFSQALSAAHGKSGEVLAWARRWGFTGPLDPFLFPARRAYLRYASAVLVHNQMAERVVESELPGLPVRCVPLAVAALEGGDGPTLRRQLGLGEGELLAVHLGFLTPAKGLGVVLRALAILQELSMPVRLMVVGEGREEESLTVSVHEMGLSSQVVFFGYASREHLANILAAADVGLVPRFPTAGETSAAVLRFLACGKPVVVCGYEQFLEFPEEVALRIRPGPEGAVELARWLAFLAKNPDSLSEKKRQAHESWKVGGHDPAVAAAKLVAAVADLASTLGGLGGRKLEANGVV